MNNSTVSCKGRSRIAWWLLAIVLGVLLGYSILTYLGAFVLGVFIYYATRPIYERFEEWIYPRTLGVMIALVTISLPVLILMGYTVFMIAVNLQGLGVGSGMEFSTYRELLAPYFDLSGVNSPQEFVSFLVTNPQQLSGLFAPSAVQRLLESVGTYLAVLASGLLQAFIALAVAFYLLRDDHKLAGWVRTALGRDDDTLVAYGQAIDQDLKTIYFGNILNAFVVAVTATLLYHALNLIAPSGVAIPAPTLLGLLTGAASLIPVIGMKIIYIPITLYLGVIAVMSGLSLLWFPVLFVIAAAALIDGLTELLLRPYISGRNLHVGLVLFAYILGPLIFGWYGLFLGPLVVVLIIHFARIVLPELIHGDPLTPKAIGADPIPDADAPSDNDTEADDTGETNLRDDTLDDQSSASADTADESAESPSDGP